ncbi:hypothetical protein SLS61_003037 [Didymella pomorum]
MAPHKAEDEGDVSHCVHNLIEAFTNGLNIFKRLRERRRKHKARKEIQTPEPINSAELQLSNSLRRGPQDLAERYEECYGQKNMGSRFAKGDSIAHASLAEILMRLNTGLVSIITAFLHHEQKGVQGHMKMNYKSLTDLSEASRRDALTTLRTNAPRYAESLGNSSDSSKDTRKSTASKRRPSGSHVTKMATKSSSQPQLCMVRSKSRNTTRRDSASKSSTSKPSSKSNSPHASPYTSPLQSPVPEYAVLDPMIFNRPDMKSAAQARGAYTDAPLQRPHNNHKRVDSLDVVRPAAWSPYAQPYDYFNFMPEHINQPTPKLPDLTSTPRRPSTLTPKPSYPSPKKQEPSKKQHPPPVPAKPSALSNTKRDSMSVTSAIPSPLRPTPPPGIPAPVKRRLDKVTPSSYTFASDSTKLGEIPETRWAQPWDYERAEMLNNMAACAAKVRVPSPSKEKEKEMQKERKGLRFWKRGETA